MKLESSVVSFSRNNILVIGSITLSVFFVIALWNFWFLFTDALGFNMTAFLLGTVLIFLTSQGITNWKKQFVWSIPIILIATSFSLWENPYLKIISLLLLPFIVSVSFNYALSPKSILDVKFILLSIFERITLVLKIPESLRLIFGGFYQVEEQNKKILYKIGIGLFLFAILALSVFIPLLSSVDPQFAKLTKGILDWFYELLSFRYMGRIIFATLASVFLISYFLSFEKRTLPTDNQPTTKNQLIDPVISGIVLGGVLSLYLIFIAIQFSHLFVGQLPFDFRTTEQLVKSGFWQLITLSIINIIFFFSYFRKTHSIVQNILKAFTIASFLLLLSAGHRMFLYVFFYGLSYEKFFASYTVVYCSFLFLALAYQVFANRENNLFKQLLFSLLWMYSVATVLPIERIIFTFNANVSQRPDSRIDMDELMMLSYDALPLVETYRKDSEWQENWCHWANGEIRKVAKKEWYEKNLANFTTIKNPDIWKNWKCLRDEKPAMPIEALPSQMEDTQKKHYNDSEFSFQVFYPDKEWKVVRIFDYEKNDTRGIHIYKNAESDVTIQPLGIHKLAIDPRIKPTVTELSGEIQGKKTVWENPDGSGMISIQLSSYPKSWNSAHAIEAQYTKNTRKEVENILESIAWKE